MGPDPPYDSRNWAPRNCRNHRSAPGSLRRGTLLTAALPLEVLVEELEVGLGSSDAVLALEETVAFIVKYHVFHGDTVGPRRRDDFVALDLVDARVVGSLHDQQRLWRVSDSSACAAPSMQYTPSTAESTSRMTRKLVRYLKKDMHCSCVCLTKCSAGRNGKRKQPSLRLLWFPVLRPAITGKRGTDLPLEDIVGDSAIHVRCRTRPHLMRLGNLILGSSHARRRHCEWACIVGFVLSRVRCPTSSAERFSRTPPLSIQRRGAASRGRR